jgi:beta-lactamase class A
MKEFRTANLLLAFIVCLYSATTLAQKANYQNWKSNYNKGLELVDAKKVTATMRELGAPDIEVLRGVEDIKAFDKGLSNTTTAFDLMKVFEAIGRDEIISEQACQEMMEVLFAQEFNEIIPAKLPADVKVAHKTGSITGVQHDSGIVVLPNGHEYVLILLSKDLPNPELGVELLSEISKLIYDYVVSDKHQQH